MTHSILGIPIHSLAGMDLLDRAADMMASKSAHHIITANSLLILEAQTSPALKNACLSASLVIPESSGITWAARTLRLLAPPRIPGIDFSYELCQLAETLGFPVYLLGGEEGVGEKAGRFLSEKFPNLVIGGARSGFFRKEEEPSIIDEIRGTQSRLILIALGMPRQEIWIHENRHRLPPGIYMGVGGTFDIWSGRLKRAPLWMRRSGLEWMYRVGQQPSRWKRIASLPTFALKVLSARREDAGQGVTRSDHPRDF